MNSLPTIVKSWIRVPSKRGLVLLVLASLRSLSAASDASNTSEFSVQSRFDSRVPYLIVRTDPMGSSKRKTVGIYSSVNEDGQKKVIFRGNVLAGNGNEGILDQLELTTRTARNEALAVLDGKLLMFHTTSDEKDPSTFVEVGSEEHPLIDPVTGYPIELKPIKNTQHIQIAAGPIVGDTMSILISVKQNNQYGGTGLTFILTVEVPTKAKDRSIKLLHPPYLIDINFYSSSLLAGLFIDDESRVFSRHQAQQFALPRRDDLNFVKQWRSDLREWLAMYEKDRSEDLVDVDVHSTIPTYDYVENKVALSSSPKGQIVDELYQVYDPIAKHYYIARKEGDDDEDENFQKLMDKKVDTYSEGEQKGEFIVHEMSVTRHSGLNDRIRNTKSAINLSSINSARLLKIEGVWNLVLHDENGEHNWVQIKGNLIPDDLEGVSLDLLEENATDNLEETRYFYLVYSLPSDRGGSSKTVSIPIKYHRDVLEEPKRGIALSPQSFSNVDIMHRFIENGDHWVFDHLTPALPTAEGAKNLSTIYEETHVKTHSHINMYTSSATGLDLDYLAPVELDDFGSGLTYEVYGSDKVNLAKSGLYIRHKTHRDDDGELLYTVPGKLINNKPTEQTVLMDAEKAYQAQVKAFVIDTKFATEPKDEALNVVLLVAPKSDSPAQFKTVFHKLLQNQIPSNEFLYLQIYPGLYNRSNEFHVFLGVLVNGKPTVQYKKYIIRYTRSTGATAVEMLSNHNIEVRDGDPNELKSRLAFDASGELYWVNTPQLGRKDLMFSLTTLGSNAFRSEIKVNSSMHKDKKFIFIDDAETKGLLSENAAWRGRSSTSWVLSSQASLEVRLGDHYKTDHIKEGIKAHKQTERGFYQIRELLESLADPSTRDQSRVLIVNKTEKALIKMYMMRELLNTQNKFWKFNPLLSVSYAGREQMSQTEMLGNLTFLSQKDTTKATKNLLVADAEDLFVGTSNSLRPINNSGETLALDNPMGTTDNMSTINPHFFYMMATGGELEAFDKFSQSPKNQQPFSSLILATPDEWRNVERTLATVEKEAGFLNRLELDYRYLNGTWKLWGPESGKESDAVKVLAATKNVLAEQEKEVFPSLLEILETMARPLEGNAKHKILIVPDELKATVNSVLLNYWLDTRNMKEKGSAWNAANPLLDIYKIAPSGDQRDFFSNYEILRKGLNYQRVPVVVGDLGEVRACGRPSSNGEDKFRISDNPMEGVETSAADSLFVEQDFSNNAATEPHALYLIASEGHKVNLTKFKQSQAELKIPTLLIGTESEWSRIQEDLNLEKRVGLEDSFEIVRLQAPSIVEQKQFIFKILAKPEIKALDFKFEFENKTGDIAKDQLAAFLINRSSSYARSFRMDPTLALLKLLNEFSRGLREDPLLRKSGVLNRSFLQRVFTKIFNLPLNLSDLPTNDPMVQLAKHREVALMMEDPQFDRSKPYVGPIDLKILFLKALSEHLSGAQSPLNIPSSVIAYGEQGSGKTHFFEKLIEVLNLKTYNYQSNENQDAQAVIIKVGSILDDDPNAAKEEKETQQNKNQRGMTVTKAPNPMSENLTVDQVIEGLWDLLSQPNGYKAMIVFDDFHKGSNNVRKRLLAFMTSLFDAQHGKIVVHSKDKTRHFEIPTRNIMLGMTINPTDNKKKQETYHKTGSDEDKILATIAPDDHPLDRSFLGRWGKKIKIEKFPEEGKAPALIENLRQQNKERFNSQGYLSFIEPQSAHSLVSQFKGLDIRRFLNESARVFIDISERDLAHQHPIKVIVPRDFLLQSSKDYNDRGGEGEESTSGWLATGTDADKISAYAQKNLVAVGVTPNEPQGRLLLLSLISNTFRTLVYEALAKQLLKREGLQISDNQFVNINAQLLGALNAHILTNPRIFNSQLDLDFSEMGYGRVVDREGIDALLQHEKEILRGKYFPVVDFKVVNPNDAFSLMGLRSISSALPTRGQVLGQSANQLLSPLTEFMNKFLRVRSIQDLNDPLGWGKHLAVNDADIMAYPLGERLFGIMATFMENINHQDLYELRQPGFSTPNIYESSRLFFYALDRAIARLPWSQIEPAMLKLLDRMTQDVGIGELPAVQHFLFESQFSPFTSPSQYRVFQTLEASEGFHRVRQNEESQWRSGFSQKCERFLKP